MLRRQQQFLFLMLCAVIQREVDGSGCPHHWRQFKGFCYTNTKYIMTYDKGHNFCDYFLQSSLVEVKDLAENTFLSNLTSRKSWLGYRRCHDRRFFWTDSEPANFTSWDTGSGQPDNKDTNEKCVFISGTGNWSDGICLERKAFVCQKINNKCNTVSECYVLKRTLSKWDEARSKCRAEGLRLAKISSPEDNIAVANLLRDASDAWIGLQRENNFCVENSTGITYHNWDFHEPNDQNLKENCVAIGAQGKWSDEECNSSLSVICKRDVNECLNQEEHGCDENAVCINTLGSFSCDTCKDGYARDGKSCSRKTVTAIILGSLLGLCFLVILALIWYILRKRRRWL